MLEPRAACSTEVRANEMKKGVLYRNRLYSEDEVAVMMDTSPPAAKARFRTWK